jgi:hypothetical protein
VQPVALRKLARDRKPIAAGAGDRRVALEQPFADIVRKARAVIGDPDGGGGVILFQRERYPSGRPGNARNADRIVDQIEQDTE